ncbi:teichoic acid biosynthesis protein B [Listeria floridensis FSL S10-1187]|uniref:Teichoic acid biosynthesis protein B n=1 Tax=Listeria floridensis FSL S10-1187 TaxID=1265817 RepID=A0ABN0RCN6_9LIST|nr:CDP-glycerol glycerophosphotransferase family protein [Listeria floridensis]EUJ27461.1 teichoic acid biosynthesis protein B [Listeria floridensis FSL S10-1187]
MKRLVASLYLTLLRVVAALFRPLKVQTKVVMLATFQDNPEAILKKMAELRVNPETILFYDPRIDETKLAQNFVRAIPMSIKTIVKRIYHMSTAKVVIVDNYFPELAIMKFSGKTDCIQIWHANGALKKFAWEDKSVSNRAANEQKRFKAVYERFSQIVIGSDEMGEIFKRSFLASDNRLLKTGVPSTDYFYDTDQIARIKQSYQAEYQKKTILYAPTFRDGELDQARILLDLKQMKEQLANEYVLLLKLHPSVAANADVKEDDFVHIFPKQKSMREALAGADILITDYSSSPFEFSLLKRSIYFFTPDMESYDTERGLVTGFSEIIPGKAYQTTEALARGILMEEADLAEIAAFSKTWNKYSTGSSAENLVNFIQKKL